MPCCFNLNTRPCARLCQKSLTYHRIPYMKIVHYQTFDEYGDKYLLTDRLLSDWVRSQMDICIVSGFHADGCKCF